MTDTASVLSEIRSALKHGKVLRDMYLPHGSSATYHVVLKRAEAEIERLRAEVDRQCSEVLYWKDQHRRLTLETARALLPQQPQVAIGYLDAALAGADKPLDRLARMDRELFGDAVPAGAEQKPTRCMEKRTAEPLCERYRERNKYTETC